MLAQWMGAKLILCNVGGIGLDLIYKGIDRSLFVAIASKGVHMCSCVSYRYISFKKGPAYQQASVHAGLTSLFGVLPINNNNRRIHNQRLKMVVDITAPCYRVRKAANDRVIALLAYNDLPTCVDWSNAIFVNKWNKALERKAEKEDANYLNEAAEQCKAKREEATHSEALEKENTKAKREEAARKEALEKEAADHQCKAKREEAACNEALKLLEADTKMKSRLSSAASIAREKAFFATILSEAKKKSSSHKPCMCSQQSQRAFI
jgi:hypothetical protein